MRKTIAAVVLSVSHFAAASAFAAGPAYPQSTIPGIKPTTDNVYCRRVCKVWGYCGVGYNRYRCCKVSVCH